MIHVKLAISNWCTTKPCNINKGNKLRLDGCYGGKWAVGPTGTCKAKKVTARQANIP